MSEIDVVLYKAQFSPVAMQHYKGGLSINYVDYPLFREPDTVFTVPCPLCDNAYKSGDERKAKWRVIQHLESRHCLIVNWAINGFEDRCTKP